MEPMDTYPLTIDLAHKWDDEVDSKIKTSILSFLPHSTTKSGQSVANETSLAFKPEHNIGGFLDEVQDICIYTSKYLPANHVSQDRLVEIVKAIRELPEREEQPQWRNIFGTGSYMLVEATGEKTTTEADMKNITDRFSLLKTGAQDLCRLHIDTPENKVRRTYLRNLNAFMARLTRDGISDCSYQALIAFAQALEKAETYATTRTMDVLIVYDWLRLAAEKLMEAEIKDAGVRGELWDDEKRGFSQERWMFWSKRLEGIENDAGYEDQAREVAGKAKQILEQFLEGDR